MPFLKTVVLVAIQLALVGALAACNTSVAGDAVTPTIEPNDRCHSAGDDASIIEHGGCADDFHRLRSPGCSHRCR